MIDHAYERQNCQAHFQIIIKHYVEIAIAHKGLPFTTNPKPRALLCIQPRTNYSTSCTIYPLSVHSCISF